MSGPKCERCDGLLNYWDPARLGDHVLPCRFPSDGWMHLAIVGGIGPARIHGS